MAKKTKKNTVVKKAVKAAKPAKKNKPAQAKAKAKPVKAAPKKSAKPDVKKKAAKAAKPSKATSTKKIPAKGNAGKAAKTQVKSKITTKAQAKAVKKAAPAKPVKPVKAAKPVKPVKPVKAAAKAAPAVPKKASKPAAPVSKEKAAPKKAAEPVSKAPVNKTEDKPKAAKAAPPKEEKKKPAPVAKEKKSKAKKAEGEEEEPIILEEIPVVDPELLNIPKSANGKKGRGKKAPAGPRVIVEPIAPPKPQVMPADKKKEPKGKFEMEYVVHASAYLLFEFITTPSGLSEWFADDVNIRQGIYTFFWDGSEQQAKLIAYKEGKLARFQWMDKNDGSYFEFRLEIDELTGDVSLIITDFAEDANEMATTKLLWDSQVNKLMHVIGAYY